MPTPRQRALQRRGSRSGPLGLCWALLTALLALGSAWPGPAATQYPSEYSVGGIASDAGALAAAELSAQAQAAEAVAAAPDAFAWPPGQPSTTLAGALAHGLTATRAWRSLHSRPYRPTGPPDEAFSNLA